MRNDVDERLVQSGIAGGGQLKVHVAVPGTRGALMQHGMGLAGQEDFFDLAHGEEPRCLGTLEWLEGPPCTGIGCAWIAYDMYIVRPDRHRCQAILYDCSFLFVS